MKKSFPATLAELDIALTDISTQGATTEEINAFINEYESRQPDSLPPVQGPGIEDVSLTETSDSPFAGAKAEAVAMEDPIQNLGIFQEYLKPGLKKLAKYESPLPTGAKALSVIASPFVSDETEKYIEEELPTDVYAGIGHAAAAVPEVGTKLFSGASKALNVLTYPQDKLVEFITGQNPAEMEEEVLEKLVKSGEDLTKQLDIKIEEIFGQNPEAKEVGKFVARTAPELLPYFVGTPVHLLRLKDIATVPALIHTFKVLIPDIIKWSIPRSITSTAIKSSLDETPMTIEETGKRAVFDTLFMVAAGPAVEGVTKTPGWIKQKAKNIGAYVSGLDDSVWSIIGRKPDLVRDAVHGKFGWEKISNKLNKLYRKLYMEVRGEGYRATQPMLRKLKRGASQKTLLKELSKILDDFGVKIKGKTVDISGKYSQLKGAPGIQKKMDRILLDLLETPEKVTPARLQALSGRISFKAPPKAKKAQALMNKIKGVYENHYDDLLKDLPEFAKAKETWGTGTRLLQEFKAAGGTGQSTQDLMRRLLKPTRKATLESFKKFLEMVKEPNLLNEIYALDASIKIMHTDTPARITDRVLGVPKLVERAVAEKTGKVGTEISAAYKLVEADINKINSVKNILKGVYKDLPPIAREVFRKILKDDYFEEKITKSEDSITP